MTPLAGLLVEKGARVLGSDLLPLYPPMSERIAALGIPVAPGFAAAGAVGAAGSSRKQTLHIEAFGPQTVRKPLKVDVGHCRISGFCRFCRTKPCMTPQARVLPPQPWQQG